MATETEIRDELAEMGEALSEQRSVVEMLTRIAFGDAKQAARIKKARIAADKARAHLPEHGGFSVYEAQRATAYATVSIAESLLVMMEAAKRAQVRKAG